MIPIFLSCILLATAPYTIIEDRADLPLLSADLSERETTKLRLANGLEVLLISDPKADQSAASVSVHSGSWNDPIEYPGMAHFCEHMLFMGTGKYPNENTFSTSVANYAGHTNAFTAANRTVYMFSAETAGFYSLLDQFAHFFIDPLFKQGNIAREMHAVDQEFAKNLENDSWREYMVFKETGNPTHPNCMFSIGNSETLAKIPSQALQEWHRKNYGAEKMKLVIYSALPMEELQNAVVSFFSDVPVSTETPLDLSGSLRSSNQIQKITYIKPVQKKRSLTLCWELPIAFANEPSKSADLIAFALNRGQQHSLYEYLQAKQWIDSVHVQVDELGGKDHQLFQIALQLTEKGLREMESVILSCFEAIASMKQTGVPLYLFEEKNTMAQIGYQYQQRQNPFDYVMSIGKSIGEEELNTYPRPMLLASAYEPTKISKILSLLTPQNCSIFVLAPPEDTHVQPEKQEKWFGAEYSIRNIPDKWLTKWTKAKANSNICIAEPNPFLPNNLQLVESDKYSDKPTLCANDDFGLAYYTRASLFAVPEAALHIRIHSPLLTPTAKSAVLASLYIDHVTDLLHPVIQAANGAQLNCSLQVDRLALYIQISGLSEKAPLLLQEIASQMKGYPPTKEQFAMYMNRHEQEYQNGQKELAYRQAKELLDSVIVSTKHTKPEKLAALQTITYEEFLDFYSKLFEKSYAKAFFAGNMEQADAEKAWNILKSQLFQYQYPKGEHTLVQVMRMPDRGPFQIRETTQTLGNAAILLLDQGIFSFERRAAQEIVSGVLQDRFYTELRSKQKTGYIAAGNSTELEGQLFQMLLVQSNSHQPDDLLHRFELFLEEFHETLAETISEERFNLLRQSTISSLKNRFRNLQDKSALWERLAFEMNGDFAFVEKRIAAIENLQYENFIEIVREFVSRANRKRLAILFEGKLPHHFSFREVTPYEMNELCTYMPRLQ